MTGSRMTDDELMAAVMGLGAAAVKVMPDDVGVIIVAVQRVEVGTPGPAPFHPVVFSNMDEQNTVQAIKLMSGMMPVVVGNPSGKPS